ncbi:MAG: SDR family oxidoreductase [Clostridia bacterium]|nr:SDR family oxidoreductase [Clostridia bacterium]
MKTVLVTGGSSGIGEYLVRELAKKEYRIFFTYLTGKDRAEKIQAETGAIARYLNLKDRESIYALAKELNNIDILVNNAGIAEIELFTALSENQIDDMIATNLTGHILLTQKIVPNMISKKWGRIVNVASMWGITGASCEVHYSASKAGMIGFTKALAKELGLSGITVNCVAPGLIETPMSEILDEETKKAFSETLPLPRVGLPKDVSRAIEYFIDEDTSYVTGQVLAVDGGYTI